MIIKHPYPKNPGDPFYKQFADPARAYSNLPSALDYFRRNPANPEDLDPLDGLDYRRTAAADAQKEREAAKPARRVLVTITHEDTGQREELTDEPGATFQPAPPEPRTLASQPEQSDQQPALF